jgi:hypothetical protein
MLVAGDTNGFPGPTGFAGTMHQRHSPHKVSTGSHGDVSIHHLLGRGHELYGPPRGVGGESERSLE